MKCRFFSRAVFIMIMLMLGLCAAPAATVAPKPLYRDPVYDGAADTTLIWDRAGHRWVMFYTNRRANVQNLLGVSWVHGTRIGMAESADRGVTWKYTGTANINYGKPDYTHWAPEVIQHNGVYHMYLSIVPGIFNDWNALRALKPPNRSTLGATDTSPQAVTTPVLPSPTLIVGTLSAKSGARNRRRWAVPLGWLRIDLTL
jgi:hypothetical protein